MSNSIISRFARMFLSELSLVSNKLFAKSVVEIADKLVPDEFYVAPASSTGKHHLPEHNVDGGLILHTKHAVKWGIQLIQMYGPEIENLKDHMILSLLMHDLYKPITSGDDCHAEKLAKDIFNESDKEDANMALIILGVGCHMGKWGELKLDDLKYDRQREFCTLIHLADYCSTYQRHV